MWETSVFSENDTNLTELCLVAQSVTCLAKDACLTAYPGVASLIPAQSHNFCGD